MTQIVGASKDVRKMHMLHAARTVWLHYLNWIVGLIAMHGATQLLRKYRVDSKIFEFNYILQLFSSRSRRCVGWFYDKILR